MRHSRKDIQAKGNDPVGQVCVFLLVSLVHVSSFENGLRKALDQFAIEILQNASLGSAGNGHRQCLITSQTKLCREADQSPGVDLMTGGRPAPIVLAGIWNACLQYATVIARCVACTTDPGQRCRSVSTAA